jgi:hypothetical protein
VCRGGERGWSWDTDHLVQQQFLQGSAWFKAGYRQANWGGGGGCGVRQSSRCTDRPTAHCPLLMHPVEELFAFCVCMFALPLYLSPTLLCLDKHLLCPAAFPLLLTCRQPLLYSCTPHSPSSPPQMLGGAAAAAEAWGWAVRQGPGGCPATPLPGAAGGKGDVWRDMVGCACRGGMR